MALVNGGGVVEWGMGDACTGQSERGGEVAHFL